MQVYKYDDKSLYIGVVECQIDVLETRKKGETVYLLPRNATYDKPPKAKDGFNIVWNGEKWAYTEIPAEPTPPEPTEKEKKAEALATLDSQYENDKRTLLQYYLDAMIHDDTELMDEIKAEMVELDEEYASERGGE